MAAATAPTLEAESQRSPTPFANRAVVDYVFIENLSFTAVVGPDAWARKDKAQQVLVSIKWYNDISGEDNINSTLSYSKISKDVTQAIQGHTKGFPSVQALMDLILYVTVNKNWGGIALELDIHLPKALLQASGGLKYRRGYTPEEQSRDRLPFPREKLYPSTMIEDINAACIIGINPHEREAKQQIKVSLQIEEDLQKGSPEGIRNHWHGLAKNALEIIEASSYQTVEALAAALGDTLLKKWPARVITVSVSKPFAQAFVGGSGAQVTRYKEAR